MISVENIEKVLVWGLERIAEDLEFVSEYMQISTGDEYECVTLENLDTILKKQFKWIQEVLNEQL